MPPEEEDIMKTSHALTRLGFALAAPLLFSAGSITTAQAQDFPNKPIRTFITVPTGVPDVVSRMLGQQMAGSLGQPFVTEPRPGAGGLLAVQATKQSAADGYSLIFTDGAVWGIMPALRPGSFDPMKDLIPIGMVMTSSIFLSVGEKLPVKNMQEFIALAKAKPGTISYATAGSGTLHHLFMEGVRSALGINILHVPYARGTSEALPAFLGGNTDAMVSSLPVIEPHLKTGKARMILASTQRRSPMAPDVPSLADIGVRGESFSGDMGYLAPAGTPKPVVDKLADALAKAVKSTEYIEKLKAFGVEPIFRGPEEFSEIMKSDLARYARAVKVAGAKMD